MHQVTNSSTGSYVEALFGKTRLNSANDTTKVSYSSDTRNAAYRNTLILVHCNDFLGKLYPSFEWAFEITNTMKDDDEGWGSNPTSLQEYHPRRSTT